MAPFNSAFIWIYTHELKSIVEFLCLVFKYFFKNLDQVQSLYMCCVIFHIAYPSFVTLQVISDLPCLSP